MSSLSPTTYARWASDGHSWTECFMDQSGRAYFQSCSNRFCSKRTLLTMWLPRLGHVEEKHCLACTLEYLLGIHTGQAPCWLFASAWELQITPYWGATYEETLRLPENRYRGKQGICVCNQRGPNCQTDTLYSKPTSPLLSWDKLSLTMFPRLVWWIPASKVILPSE